MLGDLVRSRDNNFNLLRFLAAMLVMYGHCYPLTGQFRTYVTVIGPVDITGLAVDVFFVISGFLVTGSLFIRRDVLAFCRSRILRIYPALIVMLLLTVFVLGPGFTGLPLTHYIRHTETWHYLFTNSLLYDTRFHLPGVFNDLLYPQVVNGSLWTLPYEMAMYLSLAVMGCMTFAGPRWLPERALALLVAAVATVSTLWLLAVILSEPVMAADSVLHTRLRFVSLFFIGGSFYLWRDKISLNGVVVLVMLAIILFLRSKWIELPGLGAFKAILICYSLFVAYITLYLASVPFAIGRRFNRLGDYSYGLYIYAFPVQQVMMALFAPAAPVKLFLLAFPVALLFAVASWHWVEKPFLQRKL